jgi:hypothetical protein
VATDPEVPVSIPGTIGFSLVGLEHVPISVTKIIEELLGRNISSCGLES